MNCAPCLAIKGLDKPSITMVDGHAVCYVHYRVMLEPKKYGNEGQLIIRYLNWVPDEQRAVGGSNLWR